MNLWGSDLQECKRIFVVKLDITTLFSGGFIVYGGCARSCGLTGQALVPREWPPKKFRGGGLKSANICQILCFNSQQQLQVFWAYCIYN